MDKLELFKQAIQRLQYNRASAEYMSDMNNWCVVHATKYMPQTTPDGKLYISSHAMATDFDVPRTTVHTTLNHVVTAHGYGSWDDMPIVILAPYKGVVQENGNPAEIATADTYWSTNPKHGLVLPKGTFVIRPSDDVLFKIYKHGATYKRDNYTEKEIETIMGMLDDIDRATYEKYKNGDLEDYEIEREFWGDKRVKKMYDSAKDKRAFLRGLFEESRFDILSHYLRDAVVRMTMEKMGFRELTSHYDGSEPNEAVVKTATTAGIPATASNKGHSASFYAEMENRWAQLENILKGDSVFKKPGILDIEKPLVLVDYIQSHERNAFMMTIINSIVNNAPVDFARLYESSFAEVVNSSIEFYKLTIKANQEELKRIPTYINADKNYEKQVLDGINMLSTEIKKLSKIKTIANYDKNMATVFHKNAARLSKQYNTWRENLAKNSEYVNLVKELKNTYDMTYIQNMVGNFMCRGRG